jgi:hypothetical protein
MRPPPPLPGVGLGLWGWNFLCLRPSNTNQAHHHNKFNSIPFSFSLPSSSSCSRTRMGNSDKEVIALFNEQVNMTADELGKWLEDPQSRARCRHRRIVEILRKNPTKNPDEYDEVHPPLNNNNNNNNNPCLFLVLLFLLLLFSWSRRLDCFQGTEFFCCRKTLRIYGKWLGEFLSFAWCISGKTRHLPHFERLGLGCVVKLQ